MTTYCKFDVSPSSKCYLSTSRFINAHNKKKVILMCLRICWRFQFESESCIPFILCVPSCVCCVCARIESIENIIRKRSTIREKLSRTRSWWSIAIVTHVVCLCVFFHPWCMHLVTSIRIISNIGVSCVVCVYVLCGVHLTWTFIEHHHLPT